jgi:hypothetical protein
MGETPGIPRCGEGSAPALSFRLWGGVSFSMLRS